MARTIGDLSDYTTAIITAAHCVICYRGMMVRIFDQESGLSHITKAIAGLVVLRDAMLNDSVVDDRNLKTTRLDT